METITSGTPKQNEWATDIRDEHLRQIDRVIESRQPTAMQTRNKDRSPMATEKYDNALSAVAALNAVKEVVGSVTDAQLLIDTRKFSALELVLRAPGARESLGEAHFARAAQVLL